MCDGEMAAVRDDQHVGLAVLSGQVMLGQVMTYIAAVIFPNSI